MNSKDNKGMCASVENGLYGDVDLELLNFDLPDTLEGDGCIGDWSMNLGPIPTDIFAEVPAVSRVGDNKIGNGNYGSGGGSMDFLSLDVKETFKSQLKQHPSTFFDERKMYRIPKSFEAPSPDSVLERRVSTSTGKAKTIPLGPEVTIPVKARTNRSRPSSTSNSWSKSLLLVPLEKAKKKRRIVSQLPDNENKKCTHCEITTTPQWREGPMGPKTLCNACGVRYRSGRLFPEYRPAASPTFIPSLHSNSHRKVIEMRQKGVGFVKKPPAAISYPTGSGDGGFVKKPAITTILNSAGTGDGVFVKKPTITAIPYPVGAGDGVFVKKPRTTAIPYPVGAGDGVFVKKPTTTIPFPAGSGYGVFVNKPMGSIPTLTRLGSD